MPPHRLLPLTCSIWVALFLALPARAGELLPAPTPAGPANCPPPCLPPCEPCPPPCAPPKVVVELSQPEVRFTAPCRTQAPCAKEAAGKLVNINISKIKNRPFGGAPGAGLQPVTSIVPAFATATIPIAFQTTRFVGAAGAEFGFAGAGVARREFAAEFSRSEIEELVREAVRRESALREAARVESAQRESALRESAQREAAKREAAQRDSCAELKARLDRVEKRVGEIETQVNAIITKLSKMP